MSEFLTADTTYASNSMRGGENANHQLFSTTIASKNRNSGLESVSSLSVAPVAGEKCNVVYDQVTYFPQACAAVREKNFPGFATKVAFGDVAEAYSTKDGQSFLYLLRAGEEGCVTVKKQVLY